jgi:hypothetical protein
MEAPTLDHPPERGMGARPKKREIFLAALATFILVVVLYAYWFLREKMRDQIPPQLGE